MLASAVHHDRLVPAGAARRDRPPPVGAAPRVRPGPAASAVAGLFIHESDRDMARVAIPRPETQLVVRFGSLAQGGLDMHAFGVQPTVHRKLLRGGHRAVMVRLRLGTPEAVFGVPASAITGRIVTLGELWGDGATRRLADRLADAPDAAGAAAVLEGAIAERLAATGGLHARARLALAAADRLSTASVNAVADDLGVSERHLRRVFHEAVGMTPKSFARLMRFHRALDVARAAASASWASIATDAGYYDQAHLIAEFRAIAGVTPRALLGELRAAPSLG